jgi:putative Mg2+ transporter-C (MgtC) family protein
MTPEDITIAIRLLGALAAGGLIGLERSFRGRPAGFRTHALVCLASALLMLVTVYQGEWMVTTPIEAIRVDPTRMAQGIMTGIGFLGAGVIFKEGATVRGLTTAASIWVTSAIGILVGIGMYYPAVLGTVMVLAVLAVFRMIETRLPNEIYAHHHLKFERAAAMAEDAVRDMIRNHGFSIAELSYRLTDGGRRFEYRMVISTRDRTNSDKLARHLRGLPEVVEFSISPAGE